MFLDVTVRLGGGLALFLIFRLLLCDVLEESVILLFFLILSLRRSELESLLDINIYDKLPRVPRKLRRCLRWQLRKVPKFPRYLCALTEGDEWGDFTESDQPPHLIIVLRAMRHKSIRTKRNESRNQGT